jgi:hypothetical protein
MPWAPGTSGNPKGGGGYSRHAVRFAEKLRAGYVDDALKALQDALGDEEGSVRVAAAKEIISRGIGKPLEVNVTLADFTDDELWAEMERRLQAKKPTTPAEQVQTQ